jgi:hypothetical protein
MIYEEKSSHLFIDASATAKQFCHHMTSFGASGGKVFRPSASRLFLFYVLLGLPLVVCTIVIRHGTDLNFRALLICAASMIPFSIIAATVLSVLFPVRLTADGIHAHSAWGWRRFIRWQDIKTVRKFNLPILPWLRLYDADGSSPVWLSMFPSSPDLFKLEIQKLAPPANPILNHLD